MSNYRFKLEKYSGINSRYKCPQCGANKAFVRYIDRITGLHISPKVGKCNRLVKCQYHYSPQQYFTNEKQIITSPTLAAKKKVDFKTEVKSFIPSRDFRNSLLKAIDNNFSKYLMKILGQKAAAKLTEKYSIGTSDRWPRSTVFWQIDVNNKIRTGKIILYNPNTGKRVKKPFPHITWIHTKSHPNYQLQQCLFGEHLLRSDLIKPIAIVESEKTAIIASVYLPEFLWMATGGLNNLIPEKLLPIKERKIYLFPDSGCSRL